MGGLVSWVAEVRSSASGCPPTTPRSPAARALLLVLAVLLPGCTPQTREEVLFCPADGCAERLIAEIDGATSSVHTAIYYFTHPDIADAMIRARERGVTVQVLVEGEADVPGGANYDTVQRLLAAGIPCRDDANPAIMHDKFTIIDGAVVTTGSFNYTVSADEENNENLVILSSSRMAEAFEDEFDYLWTYGTPSSPATEED